MNDKKIVLTGDRPTGHLHLGHYVGALKNRIEMQNSGKYEMFVFIADTQALTDNAKNPQKIVDNLLEVAIDNLSVGLDPTKTTYFVQSGVPQLFELTSYFLNLVTVSRLQRNPTIKEEIKQRGFETSIPAGFLTYPVSQTADIVAFNASVIPVGEDQIPIIEQSREIIETFNKIYGNILTLPTYLLPDNKSSRRLPGLDGKAKMSKSLNNCIYLSDTKEEVSKKVMSMYTDPNHIKVTDPGNTKDNVVFIYLDALCTNREKYEELKKNYEQGGLGDITIKKYLIEVLEELLLPIREKRSYYENHKEEVINILKLGTIKASTTAQKTLDKVRNAIKINYFN